MAINQTYGNQGQFSAADISNFIQQNINDPAAIANAASQYGISAQDIQSASGYTPEQQTSYFSNAFGGPHSEQTGLEYLNNLYTKGVAPAPGGPVTTQTTDYSNSVAQTYQNVLGRQADTEGLNYWTQQLEQGKVKPEDFANALAYGAKGSDILAAQQYLDKYIFNPTDTVQQAYQSVFGRTADDPGAAYWASQIQSGAVTPDDLLKYLAEGSTGVEDRIKAQQYLGSDIFAPEDYLKKTGGAGYQDTVKFIQENLSDPTKVYEKALSLNVTPEEIYAAYQSVSPQTGYTLDQIKDYMSQGKTGYETQYNDLLTSTFGDETRREALADAYALNTGQDPTKIDFADIVNPGQLSDKSLEALQNSFKTSDLNNFQMAARVADMATNLFGADRDTAIGLRQDLWKEGKTDNELANKVYDEYAKNGKLSNATYTELMQTAAEMNPNAAIFQQNPNLYARYSPIEEAKEVNQGAGQYGYYNNAPILDAREADKVLAGNNLALDFRSGRTDDNAMGWDLNSRDAGSIKRGVAIFGVTTDPTQLKAINDLEKSLANLGQVEYVEPSGDEGGYYVAEKIKTDSEGNRYVAKEQIDSNTYERLLDNQSKLEAAAAKAGVDPAKYDSFQDLYDAVQDKTKDFYQVTGRTSGWDPNVAAATGIQTLTSDAGDMNHASVLYRREGDKLIAVQDPKIFTANDKKRSGFKAQVAPWAMPLAIMTLPFGGVGGALTQGLGALGATMPAWLQAALPTLINTGYSTAMSGGDFNDFGRNLLTAGVTNQLSSTFKQGLAGLDLGLSAGQVKGLSDLAAGALTTLAREGDVEQFVKNQGISTLINEGIDQVGKSLGLDTSSMSREDKIIMASILPAVVSGNFDQGTIMSLAAKLANSRGAQALESAQGTK